MMKYNSLSELNLQIPPREFSSAPFWVWNDLVTPEQLEQSLAALIEQGIRQVIVHPRPGLMTPYLSEEWFALWRHTLELARENDLLLWIYDENSYPSGFAGGHVAEIMPESRALGITLEAKHQVDVKDPSLLAIYRKSLQGYEKIAPVPGSGLLPEGEYWVASLEKAGISPWYGGRFHTDLIRPGVTEKFLEVTLEPYRQRFGGDFGRIIQGVFTDEPHLKPCGDIHWTPDLPEQFKLRWGEDFYAGLPYLKESSPKGLAFRHHYFQLLNELFVDRWAKPYYRYCESFGLELTGHYWEHGWPHSTTVPDNMAMAAWQQRPGIDILFNGYEEGPQAQFGNTRAVMELASVANQTGRHRTLCETYGGSGGEMTFEDYKRIGDWVAVLGVNTINEHLSSISLRGARKRDYPPTFSYHSPWMECYGELVDYFARVSHALSQGRQLNPCLVLEPTSSAWLHHFEESARLKEIGDNFQAFVVKLARSQLEFDLGSEHIIQERGAVVQTAQGQVRFQVGECAYEVVVIPAEMENLNRATCDLLLDYLEQGGVVLSCAGEDMPAYIDGQSSAECHRLRRSKGWYSVSSGDLAGKVTELCKPAAGVLLDPANQGIVYHHRRQLSDGDIIFITNTSNDVEASGQVISRAKGMREVCLDTGAVCPRGFSGGPEGCVVTAFVLPPCGSLMLYLDAEPAGPASGGAPDGVAVGNAKGQHLELPLTNFSVRRLDDNNLILDYVDVEAGGDTRTSVYWRKAAEFIFQQNGLAGNPWDHAVQFRDELLKTAFPEKSGFQATTHFSIEGAVPARLLAVVERPDLYRISCNGAECTAELNGWWLDRAFGILDIAPVARVGRNSLSIMASSMTVFHEFEAAHIIGDFSLRAIEKGFIIGPAKPLGLGDWKQQGLPLYGHRVAYSATCTVPPPAGRRVVVSLPAWQGVVAKVLVNGKKAGVIYHHPMQCEITEAVVTGANTVEVIVYGSLRNPLGPHLGVKELAITDPWSWGRGPQDEQPAGNDYYAVGYGLDRPFTVTFV
ncbi:MAG: glycosyl hydrolase [bacterium]